jgi:GT2 family glycosyltransferase
VKTAPFTAPGVTVVIPTHNRLACLLQCLSALAAQSHPSDDFEVIVVADGCSDGTGSALAGASFPFQLRVVSQAAAGAAAARNRGARDARGQLLIFLDDDVIASPDLVSAHARSRQPGSDCAVVGPYVVAKPKAHDFMQEVMYRFWKSKFDSMAAPEHRAHYRDVVSGNLSLPAATFRRVGGFNPLFPACGIEDYELGVRLLQHGVDVVYAPDARAVHLETTDVERSLRRSRSEAVADIIFARLHPQVVRDLRISRPGGPVQRLAFAAPRAGPYVERFVMGAIGIAGKLGFRGMWMFLYGKLRSYCYWRGVSDELGSRAALRAFLLERSCAGMPARRPG